MTFLYYLVLFFREMGKKGEGEGETYRCKREILIDCLLYVPQARTQTRDQTTEHLLCRVTPSKLSHTSQGKNRH